MQKFFNKYQEKEARMISVYLAPMFQTSCILCFNLLFSLKITSCENLKKKKLTEVVSEGSKHFSILKTKWNCAQFLEKMLSNFCFFIWSNLEKQPYTTYTCWRLKKFLGNYGLKFNSLALIWSQFIFLYGITG